MHSEECSDRLADQLRHLSTTYRCWARAAVSPDRRCDSGYNYIYINKIILRLCVCDAWLTMATLASKAAWDSDNSVNQKITSELLFGLTTMIQL